MYIFNILGVYNVRLVSNVVKVYPDMIQIVIYHKDYPVATGQSRSSKKAPKSTSSDDSIHRSIRRTKSTISDIIRCNRFDLWCTFTFDCSKCNTGCMNNPCSCPPDECRRFDVDFCKFRMTSWLHRQQRNDSSFSYIIVPEFHKKCVYCLKKDECRHSVTDSRFPRAVHFHAFIKYASAKLMDTGKKKNGKSVYKFRFCNLGFNYVIDISDGDDGDRNAIAQYMQKYITKDMPMFRGKKRYFSSQGLNRPQTVVNGVSKLGLWPIVKKSEPVYINDSYEIQYHPISQGFNFERRDLQTSFDVIESTKVDVSAGKKINDNIPCHEQFFDLLGSAVN